MANTSTRNFIYFKIGRFCNYNDSSKYLYINNTAQNNASFPGP